MYGSRYHAKACTDKYLNFYISTYMHRHLIVLSICPLTSDTGNKCHSEEIFQILDYLHGLIIVLETCENVF